MDTPQPTNGVNRPTPDANAGSGRGVASKPTAARPRAQKDPVVQWQVSVGEGGGEQASNVLASGESQFSQAVPQAQSAVEQLWRNELLRMQQLDRQRFRRQRGRGVPPAPGDVVPPRVPGEAAEPGVTSTLPYSPPTSTHLGSPRSSTATPSAGAEQPVSSPPSGTDLGNEGSATPAQPAGAEAPASDAESSAAREAAFQRQLEAEQRLEPARRELEGMGVARPGREADKRKFAERGTNMAGRLASAAAQDANWPFYLVIILSVFNDVFDIFDLGSLLGLDQVFDSLMFLMMLSARLFIRQGSGWISSKIAALAVEWIPLVGILPCWTIAAVYVWRRAIRLRRKRQGMATQESAALADETDAAGEAEQKPAYAEAGSSGN